MDSNSSQQLGSMPDLTALIAAMPEAISMLSTMPTAKPSAAFSTGDIPNLFLGADPMNTTLSLMLLQQQHQLLLSSLNPFAFGSIPAGMQHLSGQNALDAFTLANGLMRPLSQSAVPSPKQSITNDMRPRAFSSSATLQPSLLPTEKRRKRSHQDDGSPVERPKPFNSVLRGLVESDEEPMAMQLAPPTKSEDERLKMDAARVTVLSHAREEPTPPRKKSPEDNSSFRLRPLIRDEDLPESVGPDSPFRHHPKYQKKNFGERHPDQMDAVAMAVVSGFWPGTDVISSAATSTAENSSKGNGDYQTNSPAKTFNEILDQTLVRELVAAE